VTEVTQANLELALPSVHWQNLKMNINMSSTMMLLGWLTSTSEDVTEAVAVAGQLLEVVIVDDVLQ